MKYSTIDRYLFVLMIETFLLWIHKESGSPKKQKKIQQTIGHHQTQLTNDLMTHPLLMFCLFVGCKHAQAISS